MAKILDHFLFKALVSVQDHVLYMQRSRQLSGGLHIFITGIACTERAADKVIPLLLQQEGSSRGIYSTRHCHQYTRCHAYLLQSNMR